MNQLMTVSQVASLQDESWVNGGFEAEVLRVEVKPTKKNGQFWIAHLADVGGGAEIASMSCFTAPKFQAGDIIRVGGKGLLKKSYNGNAQINLGRESTVEVSAGEKKVLAAIHESKTQASNAQLVSGQTVGMAIKASLDLNTLGMSAKDFGMVRGQPTWWASVYETASDIIRTARLLEKGDLADPVRARSGTPASRTPAHNPEQELDEAPPF